jgi:hypothetical protein
MGGFNLPPGVTSRMIDEASGMNAICECCGHYTDDCICPECPSCLVIGHPECYADHGASPTCEGMHYTKAQRLGQARRRVLDLEDQIAAEGQYIAWLESQSDDWVDKDEEEV